MNVKYRVHPGEYAIGENEQFYTEQAAKGWILEKRGSYLSKFRRGEPARLRYRIELTARVPAFAIEDELALPEAQIALYEDCGWQLVTRQGLIHVFSAPEDSEAPEFYSEPEQQARTLWALRRSYRVSAVIILLALCFIAWFSLTGSGQASGGLGAEMVMKFIRFTAGSLFHFFWLGLLFCEFFYGGMRTWLLYRRLKQGRPLDHAPGRRRWVHRAVTLFLGAGVVLSVALTVFQLTTVREEEMPPEAEGPYLVLADLGFEGERTEGYFNEGSTVETCRSLAAKMWRTSEFISGGRNGMVHMDQHVYRFPSAGAARAVVPYVIGSAVLSGPDAFQSEEVPGLDGAWRGSMEYVAVKDRWVVYVCLIGGEADVFGALADMLP